MTLSSLRSFSARLPGIVWVGLLVAAFLAASGASLFYAGAARGRGAAQLAQADADRTDAAARATAAIAHQAIADGQARADSARRDSLLRVTTRARAARDGARQQLAAARSTFELRGDTALVGRDSLPVLLPPAIATTLRRQDSLAIANELLEAERSRSDAATVSLLADKDQRIADRDTSLAAAQRQRQADAVVIDALRDAKAPRFGFRTGVAVGVATTVGVVMTLAHFLR